MAARQVSGATSLTIVASYVSWELKQRCDGCGGSERHVAELIPVASSAASIRCSDSVTVICVQCVGCVSVCPGCVCHACDAIELVCASWLRRHSGPLHVSQLSVLFGVALPVMFSASTVAATLAQASATLVTSVSNLQEFNTTGAVGVRAIAVQRHAWFADVCVAAVAQARWQVVPQTRHRRV